MIPLREELRAACALREQLLEQGRSRRKDPEQIRNSIGKARAFLRSYPVADDLRVTRWCNDHKSDVMRIVAGNNQRRLQRLLMEGLSTLEQIEVVKDQIEQSGNDVVQLAVEIQGGEGVPASPSGYPLQVLAEDGSGLSASIPNAKCK